MAQPTTVRPSKFRVLLGDGGDPEMFVAPCGLVSKSVDRQKNYSDQVIPDCDDPDAPYWVARDLESMSMEISGEGLLALEYEQQWNDAIDSTTPVNIRVEIEFTTGIRVYAGAFHVNGSLSAQQGERVKITVAMSSDGIVTSTWEPGV